MPDERRRNVQDALLRIISEERALAILRALSRCPGYSCNERIFVEYLRSVGLACTRDQVRTTICQLADISLIRQEQVDGLYVCELTTRGKDVGTGLVSAEGVAKPDPECPY